MNVQASPSLLQCLSTSAYVRQDFRQAPPRIGNSLSKRKLTSVLIQENKCYMTQNSLGFMIWHFKNTTFRETTFNCFFFFLLKTGHYKTYKDFESEGCITAPDPIRCASHEGDFPRCFRQSCDHDGIECRINLRGL